MQLTSRQLKEIIREELRLVTEETMAQQMAADRARYRGTDQGVVGHTPEHRGEAEDVTDNTPHWIKVGGEWVLARTGQNQLGGKVVRGMEDFGSWGGAPGDWAEEHIMEPYLRFPAETLGAGLAPQNIDWVEHERERQAQVVADREARQAGRGPRIADWGDPTVPVGPNPDYYTRVPDRPDWSMHGPSEPATPTTPPQIDMSRLAADPRLVRFHDDTPGQAERRAVQFATRTGQIPASYLAENYLSLNEMIEHEIDRILNGVLLK